MSDFSFLKNPKRRVRNNGVYIGENNVFFPVNLEEIKEAEALLGEELPDQLKDFYMQIGYGHLTTPHNPPLDYECRSSNEILPPIVVANFSKGILQWKWQEHWMSEDMAYDLLEPGDLPFFEMYDSTHFLIMKIHSDNPNAVWTLSNIKIEDSFEKFIWRLYYESPGYYGDIIESHYKKAKTRHNSNTTDTLETR